MQPTQPEIIHAGAVIPASPFLTFPRPTVARLPVEADPARADQSEPQFNPEPNLLDSRSIELGHDARNLISALDLYCQLLGAPGVLNPDFACYAEDLRKLAGSGARLIEALTESRNGLPSRRAPGAQLSGSGALPLARRPFPGIEDLALELHSLEGLLRSLAGPKIRVEVESRPCAGRLALNSEDLLRILFNLVANAGEAMASTPAELRRRPLLRITAQRGGAAGFLPRHMPTGRETVVLSIRDNGPGIAARHLPHIFDPGFSTRRSQRSPAEHSYVRDASGSRRQESGDAPCGLGLAIVRHLVAAAGGAVRAVSPQGLGVRFDIEIPILPLERLELAEPRGCREISDLKQISAQIEKEA
jgi:signal transduction histidine kinase